MERNRGDASRDLKKAKEAARKLGIRKALRVV